MAKKIVFRPLSGESGAGRVLAQVMEGWISRDDAHLFSSLCWPPSEAMIFLTSILQHAFHVLNISIYYLSCTIWGQ